MVLPSVLRVVKQSIHLDRGLLVHIGQIDTKTPCKHQPPDRWLQWLPLNSDRCQLIDRWAVLSICQNWPRGEGRNEGSIPNLSRPSFLPLIWWNKPDLGWLNSYSSTLAYIALPLWSQISCDAIMKNKKPGLLEKLPFCKAGGVLGGMWFLGTQMQNKWMIWASQTNAQIKT